MNPKTIVWIARSLDRIARATTILAAVQLPPFSTHGPSADLQERIAQLYSDVFWSRQQTTSDSDAA